jgi:hypothetical protein
MENIASSFVSEYEFIKDVNEDIISAVFPMHQHLKRENNKRMILGGSIETGMSRFDELGIPVGLYLETPQFQLHNEPTNSKHNKFAVMDNELFDKLLGKVSSVKPYSGTRRNNVYIKTKHTKKTSK